MTTGKLAETAADSVIMPENKSDEQVESANPATKATDEEDTQPAALSHDIKESEEA
jgi:hypothetical protein